mmetsp:Transcript_38869/g.49626  ORF Transcript_38869/g.49626 Transcript_38869/m.49626 type:complete len:177 (-) Transcript_38869:495-1025(-)
MPLFNLFTQKNNKDSSGRRNCNSINSSNRYHFSNSKYKEQFVGSSEMYQDVELQSSKGNSFLPDDSHLFFEHSKTSPNSNSSIQIVKISLNETMPNICTPDNCHPVFSIPEFAAMNKKKSYTSDPTFTVDSNPQQTQMMQNHKFLGRSPHRCNTELFRSLAEDFDAVAEMKENEHR